jgi:hypothetical protein
MDSYPRKRVFTGRSVPVLATDVKSHLPLPPPKEDKTHLSPFGGSRGRLIFYRVLLVMLTLFENLFFSF